MTEIERKDCLPIFKTPLNNVVDTNFRTTSALSQRQLFISMVRATVCRKKHTEGNDQ